MPLTDKGQKILKGMEDTYGSKEKAKSVLYASKNSGRISGIDAATPSLATTPSSAPNTMAKQKQAAPLGARDAPKWTGRVR